jgi:hypothetical protein
MSWFGSSVESGILPSARARRACFAGFWACMAAFAPARAQKAGDLNAQIIAWTSANSPRYHQYIEFAQHGRNQKSHCHPRSIRPHVCSDKTQTLGEKEVQNWIKKSISESC